MAFAVVRAPRLAATIVTAVTLLAAGCSSSGAPSGDTSSPTPSAAAASATPTALPEPPVTPLRWSGCGSGLQCGAVQVPQDYATPGGPLLSLAVTRHPASHPVGPASRRGVLVVDFGGPGLSGGELLKVASGLLPPGLLAQFDLVSFDPRGSGKAPLRCAGGRAGGEAGFVSAAVGTPPVGVAGRPLPVAAIYRQLYAACRQAAPKLLANIDSTSEARDLDRIREALGVGAIRYLGLSYGTVLGLAYAQLFPQRVTSMVLDSPLDPTEPIADLAGQQATAAEAALSRAFRTGLSPAAARDFAALATRLKRAALPAPGGGDSTPVSLADLQFATLTYLQTPALTPQYPAALHSAVAGDGRALRTLAASQYQDVDGTPVIGAYWATICGDTAERPSPVIADDVARALAARYPRLGAISFAFAGGACTAWPAATSPVTLTTDGNTTRKIAVIGGTGDPIDPYAVAERLAGELPGALLITRDGQGHTALGNASGDTCLSSAQTRFLTDPTSLSGPLRCVDPAPK